VGGRKENRKNMVREIGRNPFQGKSVGGAEVGKWMEKLENNNNIKESSLEWNLKEKEEEIKKLKKLWVFLFIWIGT